MGTLPAAFKTAADLSGNQIEFLLELPKLGLYFSTHRSHFGQATALDQGLYLGGGWRLDANRPDYDVRIAEGGIGKVERSLDTKGRPGTIAGVTINLVNTDAYGGTLWDVSVDNTPARVMVGYRGLSYASFHLIFTGVVDNTEETDTLLRFRLVDNRLRFRRDLNTPIGVRFYPGTPRANRGKFIPISLGRQTNIEAIQIQGAAQGTLAFEAGLGVSELFINEFGANFPNSGECDLDGDTVNYTGREIRVIQGQSYLTLTGVTGVTNPAKPPGTDLVLQNFSEIYLVSYEVGEVTEVRDDNGVISSANYTVALKDDGADRPTTIITFDVGSAPTGTVFVDADGANVGDEAEILNGSFETGTTADWTVESGGTGSVGSTQPLDGDFYGVITGVNLGYRRLQQTFTSRQGAFYSVRFFYRDTIPSVNLFTNGDFSSGDTTGWTMVDDPVWFGAQFDVRVIDNVNRVFFGQRQTPPYGQGFQDGELYHYRYSMYQDITTVVSSDYRITGEGGLGAINFGGQPYTGQLALQGASGPNRTSITLFKSRTWYLRQIRIFVGTTADPDSIATETFTEQGTTGLITGNFNLDFTATATTTRITFEVISTAARSAVGTFLGPLIVYETSIERTSKTRFEVGDTGDPDAIIGEDLDVRYSWRQQDFTFQATGPNTQLSFASQWIGDTATGTNIDAVQLLDAGRNPADAIAYIIDNFIPEIQRDETSFQTSFNKLRGWQFGAYIPRPGDSERLLERMSFQCASRLIRGPNGILSMYVGDDTGKPAVSFDRTNIIDRSLTIRKEPINNIYNKFTIWFGQDQEEDEDNQGFAGNVYADSVSTSHPFEPLQSFCRDGELIYGGVHEFRYQAEMIRDLDTAHLFLSHLVKTRTIRHFDLSFSTWHRFGAGLREGEIVIFRHPHFATGLPWYCMVLKAATDDTRVEVVLRSLQLSGFYEAWERNTARFVTTILNETWES